MQEQHVLEHKFSDCSWPKGGPVTPQAIDKPTTLLAAFPNLSGRNVKNLLKLARMLLRARRRASGERGSAPDQPLPAPDLALFKYVARFLDLPPQAPSIVARST